MSRVVCFISKDGQVATCINNQMDCQDCNVVIPEDAKSSVKNHNFNIPLECSDCTYKRFAANMRNAEARDTQMREEGAKAERERCQAEHDKLIAVIDEKIANARVAATNKVLDELAQMYANVPEGFLEGTYRLHSEWKEKIDSLRLPWQNPDPTTVVEDITLEGAAIVQNAVKHERNRILDSLIDTFASRYCTNTDIEHGDIPRVSLDELATEIENLRSPQPKQERQ